MPKEVIRSMRRDDVKTLMQWVKDCKKSSERDMYVIGKGNELCGLIYLFNINNDNNSAQLGLLIAENIRNLRAWRKVINVNAAHLAEKYSLKVIEIKFNHDIRYFKELFRGVNLPNAERDLQIQNQRDALKIEAAAALEECNALLDVESSLRGMLRQYYEVVVNPKVNINRAERNLSRLTACLERIKSNHFGKASASLPDGQDNNTNSTTTLKGSKGQRKMDLVTELTLAFPQTAHIDFAEWTENDVLSLSRVLDFLLNIKNHKRNINRLLTQKNLQDLVRKNHSFRQAIEREDFDFVRDYLNISKKKHAAKQKKARDKGEPMLPAGVRVVVIGSGKSVAKKKELRRIVLGLGGVFGGFIEASNVRRVASAVESAQNNDTIVVLMTNHVGHKAAMQIKNKCPVVYLSNLSASHFKDELLQGALALK